MSDTFKFPNGYDVSICRKDDILNSINDSIDKKLLFAVVSQCESDINNFLKEGRWTGIPYIGNIRISKHVTKFEEIDGKDLLNSAKESLNKEQYNVFRKELNNNIAIKVKEDRLYKYMTSCYVTKHKDVYKELLKDPRASKCKDKNVFARIMCNSFLNISNYIPFDYGTK